MESLPALNEPIALPSPPPPSSLPSSSVWVLMEGQSLASDNTRHSTVVCSKDEITVKDCRKSQEEAVGMSAEVGENSAGILGCAGKAK